MMDRTLFDPIIGHSRLKEQFARLIDEDRIPHAMIFAGPAGIGKTLMAIAVASALVGRRVFPDLASREGEAVAGDKDDAFYLAPMGAMLKVDQFRQLQGELALQGETGRRRVCIIDHVETMNTEFANRMLKILEEPPSGVCFILITDQPDLLLPTIISRTQEVAVPRIAPDVLERAAQERGVTDPVKARNIARLAGGDLVELQHLVAGESDALRKENFELFCGLMRLSYNDRHLELVTWAEEAAQLSREQQRAFLRDASRLLRESYMLHAGINEISYLWGEELAFCSKFAPFVGSQNIEPLIAEIECALAQISQNGNPTIVFTHFALSVSKMIKRL